MKETYEEREERLHREHIAKVLATYTVGTKVYAPDDIRNVIMEGVVMGVEWGEYQSGSGRWCPKDGGSSPYFHAKVKHAYWKDLGQDPKKPRGIRRRELVICEDRFEFLSQGSHEWKFFADRSRAVKKLIDRIKEQIDDLDYKKAGLLGELQDLLDGKV